MEFDSVKRAFLEEPNTQRLYVNKTMLGYEPTWPIGVHPFVQDDRVSLQFWGWEIILLPNGSYYINDTSGG